MSGDGGEPHPAIAFVLPYLSLEERLSVEMVCTSLRDQVRSNNLLWRNLTIDQPFNERIRDENLLNLAAKSQGFMESLTLEECDWISNDALKIVLQNNPKIIKLCVPYCYEITVDDMIDNLKTLKLGIKLLRVNGLRFMDGWNRKDLDLQRLLSPENDSKQKSCNLSAQGRRPIDISYCKECKKVTKVYEISPKSSERENPFPPPWTRRLCGGRACGCCIECQNLGLIWYGHICHDCIGEYYSEGEFFEKIVSSACFVITEQDPIRGYAGYAGYPGYT